MTKDEKIRCDEVWFGMEVVEAQEMKRVALEMERGTVEMEKMMKVGSVLKCVLESVVKMKLERREWKTMLEKIVVGMYQ